MRVGISARDGEMAGGEKIYLKESWEVKVSGHGDRLDVEDEEKGLGKIPSVLAWAANWKAMPFTEA